jgi:hypothetical protein
MLRHVIYPEWLFHAAKLGALAITNCNHCRTGRHFANSANPDALSAFAHRHANTDSHLHSYPNGYIDAITDSYAAAYAYPAASHPGTSASVCRWHPR